MLAVAAGGRGAWSESAGARMRKDIHNSEIPALCAACEARHRGVCGALSPAQLLALSKTSSKQKAEPGAEIVYAWPSFSVYPQLTADSGATEVRVPLDADDRHDLDAMAAAITVATRLVVVCNPNNPTSTALPLADVEAFLAKVPPYVCVILDEAYCEFNTLDDPDASIDLLARHPNLVLLRTFSKVYGLCGLRVGYALAGDARFVEAVDVVRQPFFCNSAAQAAAVEALKHGDAVSMRVERALVARVDMEEGLRGLGLRVADSEANFAWVHLPGHIDEVEVLDGLTERGVLVRAGTALGRENALRVTYGSPEHNARFLAALAATLPA